MADNKINEAPQEQKLTKKNNKMIDKVLSNFRTIYQRQLGSDFQTKQRSLDKAIQNKCNSEYTKDVFLRDIAKRVDILLSFSHFREKVSELHLNPFNAATHFVLLGAQKLEDCLVREGYNNLENYPEWEQPMFNQDELSRLVPHIGQMVMQALPAHE